MGEIGGISSGNKMRINGLATGMDTDEMVKKLMLAETMKVDRVKQGRQYEQWKQEEYVDIIKDVKGLYNDYLDIANGSSDKNVLKGSMYSTSKVTSSDETAVTAIGAAGAVNGVYKIKVTQLAEPAKQSKIIGANVAAGSITVTVNGSPYTLTTTKDMTPNEFASALNGATDGSKGRLGDKVKINYSELTQKITIETRETGIKATLEIAGGVATTLGIATAKIEGKEASIDITPPGESKAITVTKSCNEFNIDNVIYNLKSPEIGKEVTLTLTPDSSESVDKVSKFIDKYNEIISKIKTKLEEKKEYNYKPLTSAQKSSMKEDEIKAWEEKAKKGILKGDMYLQKMLFDMRSSFSNGVEGAGITFKEAGFDTSRMVSDGGKILVDKDKLKKALEERGDQVLKLFTQSSSKTITSSSSVVDKKAYYDESGIFQRIKNIANDYVGYDGILIKKSGYENTRFVTNNDLSKSIQQKDTKIKDMEKMLLVKQEKYYQRFARLEKYMNSMNAQSTWLSSQMGGN